MEAGFSGKLEVQQNNHTLEVKDLHAKIGQLTIENDFLSEASSRLGLGGGKKW
jgi:transposase